LNAEPPLLIRFEQGASTPLRIRVVFFFFLKIGTFSDSLLCFLTAPQGRFCDQMVRDFLLAISGKELAPCTRLMAPAIAHQSAFPLWQRRLFDFFFVSKSPLFLEELALILFFRGSLLEY